MKAFALIIAMVITVLIQSQAEAMIQNPGAFIPQQCGVQKLDSQSQPSSPSQSSGQAQVDIAKVCVGHIVSNDGQGVQRAVEFNFTDGSVRTFQVMTSANLLIALRSGAIKSIFQLEDENGEKAAMRVIQTHEGQIQSVSGTLNGLNYRIPEMETVYTIQGGL